MTLTLLNYPTQEVDIGSKLSATQIHFVHVL